MYPVGSLAACSVDVTPEQVLTVICQTLATRLEEWRLLGFAPILNAWMERGPEIGSAATVGLPSGQVQGNYAGLDADGALLLDCPAGRKRLLAGDVLFAGGDS